MSWDQYFLSIAETVAQKSKDPSTKVGALLLSPEGSIIMTAFNGIPAGVDDLPERYERPAKYEWIQHSESNLIAFAARHGIRTKGCTVVATHHPCVTCSKLLVQAGIKEVIVGSGSLVGDHGLGISEVVFREANVMVRSIG